MSGKRAEPGLGEYARKRDFGRTPEPSGAAAATAAARLRYVIQMHDATRLHFDFRLEADGVLKSWAVPKGPSMDPRDKRFAAAVEDHPIDYRDFEGVIPAGNYGAGEVIVWDRGTYELIEGDDTAEQIAVGSVKIRLEGDKLRGAFALVHIKGRGGEDNAWLLIKERDAFVDPDWRIEAHTASAISGRSLGDVALLPGAPHAAKPRNAPLLAGGAAPGLRAPEQATPAAAKSKREPPAAKKAAPAAKKPAPAAKKASPAAKKAAAPPETRAPRAGADPLPETMAPMLATLADAAFDDPDWLFELKWDGYRALAHVAADGTVALISRNGKDFTHAFPELADVGRAFASHPAIVDGELVVLDAEGRPSFAGLQARLDRFGRASAGGTPVTFTVFDVPYADGRDLRGAPLDERKAVLEATLRDHPRVLLSRHVVGDGVALHALAVERGLEGIIAKRRASTYQERRSTDWRKVKILARQELVIGGWTDGKGSRTGFGALLVGLHEDGELVYVGNVGTGFDAKSRTAILERLEPLARARSPFAAAPKLPGVHWVEPSLAAEVRFTEWTGDGHLRHPVFVAMRDDLDAATIVREPATSKRGARA